MKPAGMIDLQQKGVLTDATTDMIPSLTSIEPRVAKDFLKVSLKAKCETMYADYLNGYMSNVNTVWIVC